uniref:CSON013925 protein n=1 Tax=Culicoides sonorensis TaxID=179676 RepID=A0A336M9Z2_CULSO
MKIEEHRICRLCAKSNPEIEDNLEIVNEIVCLKIEEILKIKIHSNDEFNLICLNCKNSVLNFHTFYKEVHDAQTFFNDKSLIISQIKVEPELFEEITVVNSEINFIDENCGTTKNELSFDDELSDKTSESEDESKEERKISNIVDKKKFKEEQLINDFYKFQCHKCKIKLKSWKKYRKHMRINHDEKRPKISCCESQIEVAHLPLLGHFYFHTHPERLKCIPCDKQYNNIRSFEQHIRKSHSDKEKKEEPKVFCPECGIALVKRCLQSHLKIHQPRVKLQCDICKKLLQSRKAMLYHMTQQHLPKNPNIDEILCNICAKSFATKDRFNHHFRYYHDETTGKCPDCDVVMRLENLRVHRKRVHEVKKVSCPICFKEFKNNDRLRGHKIKVHVEPKFECDICQKKYKTKDKMQEHRSTHFNELRFKCDLCDHMNNDYGNMTKHRKTKHRDMPYPAPGTARRIFEIARH